MQLQCKLCMQTKPLIEAHIIPKSFYAENTQLISDTIPYVKRRPIGTYDSNILCYQCDSLVLGKLDDFAKKILIDRKGIIKETVSNPAFPLQTLSYYRLEDKAGYDMLNRFFISVLWRASVSTQDDFSSFSLGSYEQLAKRAILDKSYNFHANFSIALCLLPNLEEPIHLFSPKRMRVEGINCYIAIIGFYKAIIRCDSRKLPLGLQAATISPNNDILMIEKDLIHLPEHNMLRGMIKKVQQNKSAKNKAKIEV